MKIVSVLFLLVLASCTPPGNQAQKVSWRTGDDPSEIQSLQGLSLGEAQIAQVQNEEQDFSRQTHQGYPIADTFVKKIKNAQGQVISVASVYKTDLPHLKPSDLEIFADSRSAQKKILSIPHNRITEFAEFFATWNEKNSLVWQGVYFEKTGEPYRIQFDGELRLVDLRPLKISDFDRTATLFPFGPKVSQLEEVPMRNLRLEGTLGNDLVTIKSLQPLTFDISQMQLKFSPEDHHFDPLQVYFYIERVQNWTARALGLPLRIPLNVQLQTGYPEKTNAAFYYAGNIRFGTGDGIAYAHIPQDASIVTHEVFHSLVDALARLPHEGEGGSINEAFADYFTTQVLGRPHLAESAYLMGPYKRSLTEVKKWSQKNGGLYGDSQILSGLLWELSRKLPAEKIHQVAVKVLSRLNPASQFADFNLELQSVLKSDLSEAEWAVAESLLKEREFPDVK